MHTATVSLSLGANASGSVRRMYSGTEYLTYELYSDASFTTIWNETNTVPLDFSESGASINMMIYARINPGQDASVGTYEDTISLSANF